MNKPDEKQPPAPSSLERMADLTRKVISVPKAEVDGKGKQSFPVSESTERIKRALESDKRSNPKPTR